MIDLSPDPVSSHLKKELFAPPELGGWVISEEVIGIIKIDCNMGWTPIPEQSMPASQAGRQGGVVLGRRGQCG